MSHNKINGKTKQDNIISQFYRDARSTDQNSATSKAIAQGAKNIAYREMKALELANKPKFIFESPAHIEYMNSQK